MTEELTSDAIRSLRKRRGWTQAELAHELGTDPVTVSRWERGVSRPRRSATIRLAEIARRSARRFATFPVGVAMVVVNRRSEVLLLEDPDTGLLEVPSGAVEDGETIIDAVRRELAEELGPHASLRPIGTVHAYTITYEPGVALVSVVYLVAHDGGEIVPSDDVLGTTPRWFDRSELMRRRELVRVPNDPRVLDRALSLWAREPSRSRVEAAATSVRPVTDDRPEAHGLLNAIKRDHVKLEALLASVSDYWAWEDLVSRFWHQSFKVYGIQTLTDQLVGALRGLAPGRQLNPWFEEIIAAGTGRTFAIEDNSRWPDATRPMLEAFVHARYMVEMAVKYGAELDSPPATLPSGWAALLCLFGWR